MIEDGCLIEQTTVMPMVVPPAPREVHLDQPEIVQKMIQHAEKIRTLKTLKDSIAESKVKVGGKGDIPKVRGLCAKYISGLVKCQFEEEFSTMNAKDE